MATGFTGGANAGRPMLLEGGLSWQAVTERLQYPVAFQHYLAGFTREAR